MSVKVAITGGSFGVVALLCGTYLLDKGTELSDQKMIDYGEYLIIGAFIIWLLTFVVYIATKK